MQLIIAKTILGGRGDITRNEMEIGNIVRIDSGDEAWFKIHYRGLDGKLAEITRLDVGPKGPDDLVTLKFLDNKETCLVHSQYCRFFAESIFKIKPYREIDEE